MGMIVPRVQLDGWFGLAFLAGLAVRFMCVWCMGWFGGSASRVNQIEQKIEYLPRWRAELLAKAMLGESAVIRERGRWYCREGPIDRERAKLARGAR